MAFERIDAFGPGIPQGEQQEEQDQELQEQGHPALEAVPKAARLALGDELLPEGGVRNPNAPAPYMLLGGFYRGEGLRARAAAMYRKVLELKPGDKEAAEALAELAPKKDREPPPDTDGGWGLLKNIIPK